MDLFRCVVLTTLFTEAIGGGFTISGDKTNWTTASKQCTLATPDLLFQSSGKIKVQIAESISEDVWVGYYLARTALEYFGCAANDNYTSMFRTKADPGQCMTACGGQKIIGIFGNECFCFEKTEILDNEQTMLPKCKMECKDLKGVVCGGSSEEQGGTTYISLYRSIGTNIPSDGGELNCMVYDHRGFHMKDCSQKYASTCGKGNKSWIEHKNSNQPFWTTWTESTINCFNNNTRPSTHNNIKSIHTNMSTQPLWTGLVRSQVIYKYTNDPILMGDVDKYCHRKEDNVLKYGNSNKIKKSLCVHATSLSTTTAKPNNANSTLQLRNKDGPSDVGAIVGATLSIVVIVVVVVVVLVLRKRGFQLPFLKKEKQAPSKSMIQNNNAYAISRPVEILQSTYHTDKEEYAEIDLTTTIDNEAKNGKQNDAPESSDYAHDYFVLEKPDEEQYDSTKPEDQKSYPNTYNPYNKLSFEESSNYDHVGAGNAQVGNAGRKVSDSENTYNTTSFGNSYLKKSGGESNNAYSMAEVTEDTYNHTNVPMHQMGLRSSQNDYDAI